MVLVEIYIGRAWSGGSSGEWHTDYVETPQDILSTEEFNAHIEDWLQQKGIEYAFWGVYNIRYEEDDEVLKRLVKSTCEDCGHQFAVMLIPTCRKEDDPNHDTCTDECNPQEDWYDPDVHDAGDVYYRCDSCDSLNTEKQYE